MMHGAHSSVFGQTTIIRALLTLIVACWSISMSTGTSSNTKHSNFQADLENACRGRESRSRKTADAVSQIRSGFSTGGWDGVYECFDRAVKHSFSAGTVEMPTYVTTMYDILEDAMKHPTKPRREEEFAKLQDFRSKIFDMHEAAIGERHDAYCSQADWEEKKLPEWREVFQSVELHCNTLARLQAICKTCDLIYEQKDNLLRSAETRSTAEPASGDVLDEEFDDDDNETYTIRADGGKEKHRLSVDELRKVHAASRKHGMPGHTCKPCHFASGQCWQGNECPYCHVCEKQKRKSKTQRMVAKRREEKYKIIESAGNDQALHAVKTIDEARRNFLTRSEALKQEVQHKLLKGGEKDREEALQKLMKLDHIMAELDKMVPDRADMKEGGASAGFG